MFNIYVRGQLLKKEVDNIISEIKKNNNIEISLIDTNLTSEIIKSTIKHTKDIAFLNIVLFGLGKSINHSTNLLQLGKLIGQNEQIIVYIDKKSRQKKELINFCLNYGIPICNSVKDITQTLQNYFNELTEVKPLIEIT